MNVNVWTLIVVCVTVGGGCRLWLRCRTCRRLSRWWTIIRTCRQGSALNPFTSSSPCTSASRSVVTSTSERASDLLWTNVFSDVIVKARLNAAVLHCSISIESVIELEQSRKKTVPDQFIDFMSPGLIRSVAGLVVMSPATIGGILWVVQCRSSVTDGAGTHRYWSHLACRPTSDVDNDR